MTAPVVLADIVDRGLRPTGVLLGAVGVGSTLAGTAGILARKPREQTETRGLLGTAIGCLVGLLLSRFLGLLALELSRK